MADDADPRGKLSRKLFARADASSIHRRGTPDGGEVYSGPVVRQALRAVGARAMTMDDAIFVDEDFDMSNPEDQALYAHERHHQLESGGSDEHGANDHEETAARSIERMVLHRAGTGEDFGSIMRDVETRGAGAPDAAAAAPQAGGVTESVVVDGDDAQAALAAVLSSGVVYEQLVRDLAASVVETLTNGEEQERLRAAAATNI